MGQYLRWLGCELGLLMLLTQTVAIAAQKPSPAVLPPVLLVQGQRRRLVEAERLSQQGMQQLQAKQLHAALSAWQTALDIYRDVAVRSAFPEESLAGEATLLSSIAAIYQNSSLLVGDENAVNFRAVTLYEQVTDPYYDREGAFATIGADEAAAIGDMEWAILLEIGRFFGERSAYGEALNFHQLAFEILKLLGFRESRSTPLPLFADSEGSDAQASENRREGWKAQRAIISLEMGDFHRNLGQYSEAIDSYQNGLDLSQDMGDRNQEAIALASIRDVYDLQGRNTDVTDFAQLAYADDQKAEGERLFNLAREHQGMSDSQRALSDDWFFLTQVQKLAVNPLIHWYLAALRIYRDEDVRRVYPEASQSREIAILTEAANIYYLDGEYRKGLDLYQQLLQIMRDRGDRDGEAATLNRIATVYESQGLDIGGIDLAYLARIDGQIGEAERLLEQADQETRSLRAAVEALETALTIYQSADVQNILPEVSRNKEADILDKMIVAYQNEGLYPAALTLAQQSLQTAKTRNDLDRQAKLFNTVGTLYEFQAQYEKALSAFETSLQIARSQNNLTETASALYQIGGLHFFQGDLEQALDASRQALKIAQDIDNSFQTVNSLNLIGVVSIAQGNYDDAIATLKQANQLAGETPETKYKILTNLGLAYLQTQQPALAEEILIEAVNTLSTAPSLYYDPYTFEQQQYPFRFLEQALIDQGYHERALEIAERGRAEFMARDLFDQVRTEEQSAVPDLLTLEDIKTFARQQQITLVEYSIVDFEEFFSDSLLNIWVISPDGSVTFRQQPLPENLNELVTETRQSIGVWGDRAGLIPKPNPERLAQLQAEQNKNLAQLHTLLIDPIADLLPDNPDQPVAFIPQEELFLVPFPALKDASGTYLISHHTMLTAPSIRVLQLTHVANTRSSPRQVSNKAVVVGNPAMPRVTFLNESGNFQDVQLQPLSGAQQEAQAIADLFQVPAFMGPSATEATVKPLLASASLIHLATHGLLEYGDPRETSSRSAPGAVALTPGNGEDGLLTAREISRMNLQADLVVLSACDTGRGRITGDGVMGLSRSFVAAGVPSVVVSLWSVPDAPTADLMTEFYQQLDQGQSKAQALRQAMLTTLTTHPDPKDWAAFTLIGVGD